MVWGDSNAAALYPGLNQRFRRVAEYSASGCPPLLSVEQQWRPHCKSINDDVLERVKKLRPKRLVLFANWILYSEVNVPQELSATLDVLNKALPDTLIDVIGGVPQWYPSLPVYMLKRNLKMAPNLASPNEGLVPVEALDTLLAKISAAHGAQFRSAIEALCVVRTCQVVVNFQNNRVLTAWDY